MLKRKLEHLENEASTKRFDGTLQNGSVSAGIENSINDVITDLLEGSHEEHVESNRNISRDCKIFQDSVHGTIKMDPLLVAIIDTPQFQRLRDLKQLGACYWVFPGACHNRFEHCIGTSYLCGLMLTTLRNLHQNEYDNFVDITDKEILCVKIAGLCHDLGHGPFSHIFDSKYIKRLQPDLKWEHEQASCELFDYMIETNPHLESMMREREIGVDERELIKRMIEGRNPQKDSIPETCHIDGQLLEKWYLYEIVSNKRSGIDCDKFDYFARDTHHLGMNNSFDFMRFFQNVRILAVDGQLQICVRDKEMFNLYELFHVRWALHHQVYQHKSVKVVEEMLVKALSKVDHKFGISSAITDMSRYTYLTDSIIYEILRSQDTDECVIQAKEILKRIQQRKLYHICGQINPTSTKREELPNSQPVTVDHDVIKDEIVEEGNGLLTSDDVHIDIISINHGMKDQNPVEKVIFFSKDGRPTKIRRDQLSDTLPRSYEEKHIRVYSITDEKRSIVKEAFKSWCDERGYIIPNTLIGDKSGYFTDAIKSKEDREKHCAERLSNINKNSSVKRMLTLSDNNNNITQ